MLQNSEVPKGRVNITIDVNDNGAEVKKEIPLRVLVCGNFCADTTASCSVQRVTTESLPSLLQYYKPQVALPTGLGAKNLTIRKLSDFKPDQLIRRVPKLRNLYAIRNLLKDLRTNMLDIKSLQLELKQLFRDRARCSEIAEQLQENIGGCRVKPT